MRLVLQHEARAAALARLRAKRAARTKVTSVRYAVRKHYAERRPRIGGRFVSPEEFAAHQRKQAVQTAAQGPGAVASTALSIGQQPTNAGSPMPLTVQHGMAAPAAC